MKERRLLSVEDKIFKKADIVALAILFYQQYKIATEKKQQCSVCYKISSNDRTSYESESLDLFEDGGIIDLKRIVSIEMTFHNYNLDQYINLDIVHKGSYRDGLIIQSADRNWVSGTFTAFSDLINSVTPQKNWFIEHRTFILHLLSFGIGFIIYYLLYLLIYRHIEPIKNPSGNILAIRQFFEKFPILLKLIDLFLTWLMGIPWAINVRAWFLELWPKTEFDFGPEHMKSEKQKRLRIGLVLSMAIIPTLLAIGYDLIKVLFQ